MKKDFLVRIHSIEIKGFKNTRSGMIEMPFAIGEDCFSTKSEILGIYGQNGSGKTAIIEAMEFVQKLLMGVSLAEDAVQYISRETNHCRIVVTFALSIEGRQSKVEYVVELKRLGDEICEISQESLSAAIWNGEKFEKKKMLLNFSSSDEGTAFTPVFRYKEFVSHNEENKINLRVAKKIAQKEHKSYIFNKESMNVFLSAAEETTADYTYILRALNRYACINLFVISNVYAGSISMDFLIPFTFRLNMGEKIVKGDLPIRLDGPSLLDMTRFNMARQIISEMNIVLHTLIPGLSVGMHDFGEQLLENGEIGHRIQLISKRGEVSIPLKYESEGILKIISILSALICVFNNPSMCLIIDELDAGVYEYLLGELLMVFHKSAKGQLIFTSHNLRALEMLHKTSIVFSTTNPHKRYMRMQHVKTNNNLRDLYLRSITLGGEQESVYDETDTVEIGRAFRRAGKAMHDGEKN